MMCGGCRSERAEVAGRLHDAHPEGWNPFLIELEDARRGWQLWQGGVGAVEVTPEVGGHVSNDAQDTGFAQNAVLFTSGDTYPKTLKVLKRVTRSTVWSELGELEVIVSYGQEYWEDWKKRKKAFGKRQTQAAVWEQVHGGGKRKRQAEELEN